MEMSGQMVERSNDLADSAAVSGRRAGAGPQLSVVSAPFALALPPEPAPQEWQAATGQLLDWLGVSAAFMPSEMTRRLARLGGWQASAARAPVFAPWHAWSPTALQYGGLPAMPKAQWVASYLLDHGAEGGVRQRGVDVMLMSPLPSACTVDEAGTPPQPRLAELKAMIAAARAEGRERVAIIVPARQRNAIARQLMMARQAMRGEGLTLELLSVEEALRPLAAGATCWDAIIAMPDVRGIVFTLLSGASGVRGPWPMVWHAGAGGQGLGWVTCEAAGEGLSRPALDAPALLQALAIALRHGGCLHAARRLHEGWARLRDSGVTTPGRGSDAPYVTTVSDGEFIDRLTAGLIPGKREIPAWRALPLEETAKPGSQMRPLRVVISNPTVSSR
jgi:hypothetical protein